MVERMVLRVILKTLSSGLSGSQLLLLVQWFCLSPASNFNNKSAQISHDRYQFALQHFHQFLGISAFRYQTFKLC